MNTVKRIHIYDIYKNGFARAPAPRPAPTHTPRPRFDTLTLPRAVQGLLSYLIPYLFPPRSRNPK